MTTQPNDKPAREAAKKEAEQELNCLIGMTDAKRLIAEMVGFAKTEAARVKLGKHPLSVPMHLVLTGPPGVGKTTIARIIAKLFFGNGLLSKSTFAECQRADLCGTHVGHTAAKTLRLLEENRGGAVFVDEAYELASDSTIDYGGEAIGVMNKFMEDNRDDIMVIVAGYKDRMERFFEMNAGLRGRFKREIHLPDYNPHELCKIFAQFVDDDEFQLTTPAKIRVALLIHLVWANRKWNFGNGRTVRGIWESALELQGYRLDGKVTAANSSVLTETDIPTKEHFPQFDFKRIEADISWKANCGKCSRVFSFSAADLDREARCKCGEKLVLPWWSFDFESMKNDLSDAMASHGHRFKPDLANPPSPRSRRPKKKRAPVSEWGKGVGDRLKELDGNSAPRNVPPPTPRTPPSPNPAPNRSLPARSWEPLRTAPAPKPATVPDLPPVAWWSGVAHQLVWLAIVFLFLLLLVTPTSSDALVTQAICGLLSVVNAACIVLWLVLKPGRGRLPTAASE